MISTGDLGQYPAEEDGKIRLRHCGIVLGTYDWNKVPWAKVYVSGSFHKYPVYQLKRVNAQD